MRLIHFPLNLMIWTPKLLIAAVSKSKSATKSTMQWSEVVKTKEEKKVNTTVRDSHLTFCEQLEKQTCVSAVSTLIRWVEMNRSTSVIGCDSPSGAWNKHKDCISAAPITIIWISIRETIWFLLQCWQVYITICVIIEGFWFHNGI